VQDVVACTDAFTNEKQNIQKLISSLKGDTFSATLAVVYQGSK
jgi:hypothetical protein